MKKFNFLEQEQSCLNTFNCLGPMYHFCSQENFPVICTSLDNYRTCMNILALCFSTNKSIRVLAFEIMSNHIHMIVCGEIESIRKVLELFKKILQRHLDFQDRKIPLKSLIFKEFLITDLNYARNVIAYVHRNGYLVDSSKTPFTYMWGTNLYYFNDFIREQWLPYTIQSTEKWRREATHSHLFDDMDNIMLFNGNIIPASWCDIQTGESLFQNARQYFYKLSKDIEANIEVAKMIGETIAYTDDEMFSTIAWLARKKFNCGINEMSAKDRISLAKTMHYDYNSTNKQIMRILKLEASVLSCLWPD